MILLLLAWDSASAVKPRLSIGAGYTRLGAENPALRDVDAVEGAWLLNLEASVPLGEFDLGAGYERVSGEQTYRFVTDGGVDEEFLSARANVAYASLRYSTQLFAGPMASFGMRAGVLFGQLEVGGDVPGYGRVGSRMNGEILYWEPTIALELSPGGSVVVSPMIGYRFAKGTVSTGNPRDPDARIEAQADFNGLIVRVLVGASPQ